MYVFSKYFRRMRDRRWSQFFIVLCDNRTQTEMVMKALNSIRAFICSEVLYITALNGRTRGFKKLHGNCISQSPALWLAVWRCCVVVATISCQLVPIIQSAAYWIDINQTSKNWWLSRKALENWQCFIAISLAYHQRVCFCFEGTHISFVLQ